MFDLLIITHLPVFYKVNLYNKLNEKMKVCVIFLSSDTSEKRSSDFSKLNGITFEYFTLSNGSFQERNKIKSCLNLVDLIRKVTFKKIIVSGWDQPEFWLAIALNKKENSSLALESTIFESKVSGISGAIKRYLVSRVSTIFASGEPHKKLAIALRFQGRIIITGGVGVINKPIGSMLKKNEYERRFLFVGRLCEEKNLNTLINVFNSLSEHSLTIVGAGEEYVNLKNRSNSNISFVGSISNELLKEYFANNNFLILPSVSETWGLVVEESLYYSTPVLLSDRCGCLDIIENSENGFVFDPYDEDKLMELVSSIDNNMYKKLIENVAKYDLQLKDENQVNCYFEALYENRSS
ncbi:glycosyltransferase [Vibrio sp. CAU 1672]|uniref:glycosyltransferase n=1 Tax=Vibrio sp. CAU 1672 TaxID=3032594 RepID=UPI0023DC8675|nr:glycosyltransferase [Vibrio sp. CAU 1672]MDF2155714.1 glycosyltransferase [Vibrio sp. CAU 1672]